MAGHLWKQLCRSVMGLAALAGGMHLAACASTAPKGLNRAGQMVSVVQTPADAGFAYAKLENGVQIRANGQTKNVLFYGPSIVRVNTNLGDVYTTQPSIAVIARPAAVPFSVTETGEGLRIATAKLRVDVDKQTGALSFLKPDGTVFTRESKEKPQELKKVEFSGEPTYDARNTFSLTPDESLYGLGQYNSPYMDYRGKHVLLVQTNIGIVVPFMMSTRRYGILWDTYSKMTFDDGADGATLWAESAPAGVDYYFVGADTMDGVVAGYRTLTGAAPMFPKAAFGFFMSKERYKTQEQLLDVLASFRKSGFPLDYIVQDWQYWGSDTDGTWSGMIWNKERYPDPKAMARTIHDEHAKLMISIWPSVGNDTALAHELDSHGLRFEPLHWISKKARIYDAFSTLGRQIYFKYIKDGLLDVGVDALWMDGTEVEVGGACHDAGQVERDIKRLGVNAMGDFTRYLNPYSLMTTKGTYEGQRAINDKRVLTLTRSAWAGQQRYAAMPWSGDTTAGWDTLRNQISGGVNVAMAGLPYWTQDTGGFFVNYQGGASDPTYQELFARWNQFAIFNPVYRIHGTSIDREPYRFKDSAPDLYNSLLKAAQLRYELLPYIYGLAWQTTHNSYTMMRGLAMDFPDDMAVRKTDDAFMFGPAFLVHPVTRAIYHAGPPPAKTIPVEALRTPDGAPGLAVEYFKGVDLAGPAVGKTVDATVDHTWPGPPLADPPPGLDGFDNFSGRWSGTLVAPETGEYEIGAEGDDGFRLFLDNRQIINDWTYGAKRYRSAKVQLTKGQPVTVRLEYMQGGQDRALRLCWRTPSELRALSADNPEIDNAVETYLPKGADWFDFWSNARLKGGQTATMNATLDRLPLYVRAGSILPMGPAMQYATEKPDAAYEIRVYPGADATFTLYQDDNETYNYEKGEYATVELKWDDAARTLRIGPRKGTFPGMVKSRELNIKLIDPAKAEANPPVVKTVNYTGEPVELKL